jgi:hypothetical protein
VVDPIIKREVAMTRHDKENPQEMIEEARGESFPAGVPEDADVGTGREKGKGLPPGSVGKDKDTPQTPAT